jgi:aspartate/methionine/tyrosine aminotransferase
MAFVSERTKNLGIENAFKVLKDVQDLQAQGKDIVSFCIGQPDFRSPENVCVAAKKAIDEGKHGYTASVGIPELRQAIAEHESKIKGVEFDPEDVVIANGAKNFIGYTILSVTDYGKGDEVIYPNPGYPIYETQTMVHGAKPVRLYLLEENNYNFDVEELKKLVSNKTKLLIINSPHNPTGGVLSHESLKAIADLAKDFDFFVLADEIYSELYYDGEFESIVKQDGMLERTVLMSGVSKTYSMTGWRIGYAINKQLAPYFNKWVNNVEACAGHVSQWAAVEALTGDQTEAKKMFEVFKKRRELIVEGLNKLEGFKCLKPGGAFYVFPNVSEACKKVKARDAEEFRKMLLEKAGVAVLSDIHFGTKNPTQGEHIRLSYATSTENIKEGLKRIEEFLATN